MAVGAQVSYRDLAGFGRRFMDVDPAELTDDILYQLAALDGIARVAGTRVSYVKPHGALYNAAVTHAGHAQAVVDAVLAYDRRLPVLGLPGSALLREVEAAGMHPVPEGFADRGYTPAGTLVPRTQPGALLHDPATVADRAVRMAANGVVVAVDGTALLMPVRSVCVHGDTPGAVEHGPRGADGARGRRPRRCGRSPAEGTTAGRAERTGSGLGGDHRGHARASTRAVAQLHDAARGHGRGPRPAGGPDVPRCAGRFP